PNLEKFADGARTLHPDHSPLNGVWRAAVLRGRNIQRNDTNLWDGVDRLVLATVAVHHHGGSAFFEGLPQSIHTRHSERDGLHDARAAALLRAGIVGQRGFVHPSLRGAISKVSILVGQERTALRDGAKG